MGFKPEEVLDNLSAEDIEAYLKKKRKLGQVVTENGKDKIRRGVKG